MPIFKQSKPEHTEPMKIIKITQGTPEWHDYRATHFNASDAAAMMGCSPYETRDELIERLATGVTKEVDAATQWRFDEGHRLEKLGREKAEDIISQPLFPIVGECSEDQRLSASFDGVTMDGTLNFEHKTMNAALRDFFSGDDLLPMAYTWQCQHQMLVGGMDSTLFMVGEVVDGEYKCERTYFYAHPQFQGQLVAGWNQLEKDIEAYKANPPTLKVAKAVGASPESAIALTLQVRGEVVACNVPAFKAHAIAAILAINRALVTDQDFADAEASVKWCIDVESRIKSVKEAAIGQQATIEEAFRALAEVSELVRETRLALTKEVAAEKINRRNSIAVVAQAALVAYVANLRLTHLSVPVVDFHSAMKGLKTLESCQSKVNDALAKAKIQVETDAQKIRANAEYFLANSVGFDGLFPDFAQILQKSSDDFQNTVHARIAKHKEAIAAQVDAARLAAEAKFEREAKQAEAQREQQAVTAREAQHAHTMAQFQAPNSTAPTMTLAYIQRRLEIPVTAELLETLGFKMSAVAFEQAVYHNDQFVYICDALVQHILKKKGEK